MTRYCRVLIGEAHSDAAQEQLLELMRAHGEAVRRHDVKNYGEYLGHRILAEASGRMAVMLTDWMHERSLLRYQSSHRHRMFVAESARHLAGHYVVKVFRPVE